MVRCNSNLFKVKSQDKIMNKQLLQDIGLTKGEITVYLSLLKTGETTTGKIIDEAEISSGKIYEILDKLIKKGLVSYIVKEKTRYYQGSNPTRLLDYVKEKEKQISKQKEELSKEIPKLTTLQNNINKKYETRLFQGYNGIKTVILDSINRFNEEKEIYAMGLRGSKSVEYNLLWKKWHKARVKLKIPCHMIFSVKDKHYKELNNLPKTKAKIIKGITPSATTILNDRILIFTFENEPAVLQIVNPEIRTSFATFFKSLWEIAQE